MSKATTTAVCPDCENDLPQYGVAPHECYWRKGPEFVIGQSTLLPIGEWTDCFVPDLEEGEGWDAFVYPSACGTFYCPACQRDRYQAAWTELVARIGLPPADVGAPS